MKNKIKFEIGDIVLIKGENKPGEIVYLYSGPPYCEIQYKTGYEITKIEFIVHSIIKLNK